MTSIPLRPSPSLLHAVRELETALHQADRRRVAALAQRIADGVCADMRVPTLWVSVQGRRPSSRAGELHGLYTPGERDRRDAVKVWMMTAKRAQVVAFRTFLRTLVHELCHHLDYTFLDLSDSLHSDGFYMRESAMVRRLVDGAGLGSAAGVARVGGDRRAPAAGHPRVSGRVVRGSS